MTNQTTKRTEDVSVFVDGKERRFTLKRFTIQEAIDPLRIQETAWNAAEQAREEAVGNPLVLTLSSEAYLRGVGPQVVSLLRFPADGGEPLTLEEFRLLDPDDPAMVLAKQEELSSIRNLILNGQLVLCEAEEKMKAEIETELDRVSTAEVSGV